MSDDNGNDGFGSDYPGPEDFSEPADIHEYLDDVTDDEQFLWDNSPTGDMSEGQLEALADLIDDGFTEEEWEDIYADIDSGEWDYWAWFDDLYNQG